MFNLLIHNGECLKYMIDFVVSRLRGSISCGYGSAFPDLFFDIAHILPFKVQV